MKLENAFKNTILLHLAAFAGSLISAFYPSEQIEKVTEILDQSNWYADNEGSYFALWLIIIVIIIAYFYGLYGIYNFKKKGKSIFTYTLIALTLSTLFLGDFAYTSFIMFFYEVNCLTSGALLVFLHFSNLSKKFK